MNNKDRLVFGALLALSFSQCANALVVHAGAPISVPVDSPIALGALATLIALIVARSFKKK